MIYSTNWLNKLDFAWYTYPVSWEIFQLTWQNYLFLGSSQLVNNFRKKYCLVNPSSRSERIFKKWPDLILIQLFLFNNSEQNYLPFFYSPSEHNYYWFWNVENNLNTFCSTQIKLGWDIIIYCLLASLIFWNKLLSEEYLEERLMFKTH